jgi:hypothetical protein
MSLTRPRGSAVPRAWRRGTFRRLIVGTALVAAAGVALPEVAIAAPVRAASASAAERSTDVERSNAASKIGVVIDESWIIISEREFVAKIYYTSAEKDKSRPLEPHYQKIREAAIAALAIDGDAASTKFIKTDIFPASEADQKIVLERTARKGEELRVKAAAAELIGIPVNDTILAKSIYDFIVHIDLNAHDHNDMAVRAAARAALQCTAEAQWNFLTVGINDEHTKDVLRLIQERNDQTEAEKERLRRIAARVAAAGYALKLYGAPATELAQRDDRDFSVEIYNRAPANTEVSLAALRAMSSLEPAVWKTFVDTGAREARLRDDKAESDRRDRENTRQIVELRTRAANSLIYLELVKAADAALAGSAIDRAVFLVSGQYQHQTQSLRIDAYNGVESYVADRNGAVVIDPWSPGNHPDQQWKIEPGLSNPECFSFQSVSRPHNYLRLRSGRSSAAKDAKIPPNYSLTANVDPTDGTSQFKADATWCVKGNAEAQILRPVQWMNYYLTVNGAIHDSWGNVPAKWHAEPPQPLTPFDRRYAADQNLRTSLGQPTGDPVLDANNLGYRKYEKGRLYLTSDMVKTDGSDYRRITVHVVYNGPVLDKFLSVGGPNAIQGELFDQVPTKDGKGQVIRIGRPAGGYFHIIWSPATGAHVVYGAVGNTWAASGGEIGPYGYPVTDETTYSPGVVYSRFTGGTIQHSGGGIMEIKGEIHRKFAALGFEEGLGLAYGPEEPFGTEGARWQSFSGGSVIITPRNGTVALTGAIDREYHRAGLAKLGYPLSDAQPTADGVGKVANFSLGGGAIYDSPRTNATLVYGAIAAKYREIGAERSFLGYPATDETALPKGTRSTFENGRIDSSNDGGLPVAYRTTTVPHRSVQIKGAESGRCIQVAGAGEDALKNFAATELWECISGAVKQIWDVVDRGNNIYTLKNRNSGKCLDLPYGELHNGRSIAQHDCNNSTPQQWEFTTAADGTLALRSVHSAKVVQAYNPPTPGNATPVTQYADRGEASQRWTLVPVN